VPWEVKDVPRFKKGLTESQKKKWVKVANGIYSECIKGGGSDKTCAAKAIRIANSKFSEEDGMTKVPVSAFSFTEPEAVMMKDGENNVDIVAYSGKVIKNHWYWGDLVIDVNGADFNKKLYPILEQHDLMRKIGFSAKPSTDNNQLTIKKMTFVDTEASKEFQTISKQGFPFEASISGRPTLVEQLEEGESTEVNGYKFKGPGSVWRKWIYKETSVVVFGADGNTRSRTLAEDEEEFEVDIKRSNTSSEDGENNEETEVKKVDLKELKEKDPKAYDAILKEATDLIRSEGQSDPKSKELSDKLIAAETQMSSLKVDLDKASAKILEFEKAETIRKEKEIQREAEGIWQNKLSASEIPEHLYAKVKSHVSYEKFVKEGAFNAEDFGKAVDAEIADWVKGGVKKSVLGSSFADKTPTGENLADKEKEDKDWLDKMHELSGQKKK
jgi:hypothetical protein